MKCLRSPSDLKDEQEAKVCNKFSLLLGFWDITKFIYLYEWDKTVSQYDLWNNSKVRNESPFFLLNLFYTMATGYIWNSHGQRRGRDKHGKKMHVEIQKLVVYMMEKSFKIPDKAGKMCVGREAGPYTLIG